MAEPTQDIGYSLADYLSVLRRRWLGAFGLAALAVAGAVWLAWSLPATYESEGTVLVEREEIPEGLVNSTVTGYAQERIENIKRRSLTRERLVEMAKRYNLFSDLLDNNDETTAVSMMRQALTIELLNVEQNPGGRRGQSKVVIAFTVSYQADDPKLAQSVTNEVMNMFMAENQALRIEQSGEVVSFFERTAAKLETEINGIEQRISDYKQSKGNALPDQMLSNRRKLSDLEQQLLSFNDRERDLRNQRNELSVQLASMDPYYSGTSSSRIASPSAQLVQAKAELATAKERYSEIHPEIGRLQMLISGLEKEVQKTSRIGQLQDALSATNPEYLRASAKLNSIDVDLSALAEQRTAVRDEVSALEVSIAQGPEVERELRSLSLELESTRKQYREFKDKQLDARVAADVETDQKGGGFRILEPANVPSQPISPDRQGIVVLGVLAGMLIALLWMFIAELLDRAVRGQRGVIRATGFAPIAVVPNMSTGWE